MLTPGASWRTLGFLPPGPAALLCAPSQEDDRPHGQDRSQQERQRVGKVSVPDRGYPVFQRHPSAFRAFCRDACFTWGLRGQGCSLQPKLCDELSSVWQRRAIERRSLNMHGGKRVTQTPEVTNQTSLSSSPSVSWHVGHFKGLHR